MFLAEENVVRLMTQNGANVPRVRGTVTLMLAVLEILSVDVTTAGSIMRMPHLRMTAARQNKSFYKLFIFNDLVILGQSKLCRISQLLNV